MKFTSIGEGPLAALIALSLASPALAWGNVGHEVVALIAYQHLSPAAKAKVDAILAGDHDALTSPDFASRATWADAYREKNRKTAGWHFTDVEISNSDLDKACFGFPKLPAGTPALMGTPNDCAANKVAQFAAELHDPATPANERAIALKFVMHFVGDLHQPLHSSDDNDRGGNCVAISGDSAPNLHAFWDTSAVLALGANPDAIATKLNAEITAQDVQAWSTGDPKTWTMEAFALAKQDAYNLPSHGTCAQKASSIALSSAYKTQAEADAAGQLERAGIRLAQVLNQALD